MDITRRGFLKGCLAGLAAASIPIGLIDKVSSELNVEEGGSFLTANRFDPNSEYGNAIPVSDYKNIDDKVIKVLTNDAKRILPKGTPFELRAKISTNCGRSSMGIAWYYSPEFKNKKRKLFLEMNSKDWEFNKSGGFILLGRGVI